MFPPRELAGSEILDPRIQEPPWPSRILDLSLGPQKKDTRLLLFLHPRMSRNSHSRHPRVVKRTASLLPLDLTFPGSAPRTSCNQRCLSSSPLQPRPFVLAFLELSSVQTTLATPECSECAKPQDSTFNILSCRWWWARREKSFGLVSGLFSRARSVCVITEWCTQIWCTVFSH